MHSLKAILFAIRPSILLKIMGVFVCLGMVLLMLSAYFSCNPSGTYFLQGFATDRYLTLRNGNVYEDTISQKNMLISSYYQMNGIWYGGSGTNNEAMIIRSSIFGIETKSISGAGINEFYPRYGFAWIFKLCKRCEHDELAINPTVPK